MNADFDKKRRKFPVGGKLPANSDRYARLSGVFCRHFQQLKQRGMMRVAEAAQGIISPVYREGILGKIVCPHAEKIGFLCQLSAFKGRRRRLDHYAQGNLL